MKKYFVWGFLSFLVIAFACHKKHDYTPSPTSTLSNCVITSEYRNGIIAGSFVYNSNSKDSIIILYDSTGAIAVKVSLVYYSDGAFNKISFTKGSVSGYISYKYDSQDRPIGQYTYVDFFGAMLIDSVSFSYSGNSSNIIKETNYSIGNVLLGTSSSVYISYYTYDINGNVLTETDSASGAITDSYIYTYDNDLSSQGVNLSNAINEFNTTNKYPDIAYLNCKNNIVSMTHKDGNGVVQSDSYSATYTYNNNNNPITEAYTSGGKTINYLYNYNCK